MIIINWITDLIDKIPEIISYIVYGYVYLIAYYWISFKDNKDFKNVLIKSVAASYLLTSLYDLFVSRYHIIFSNNYYKVITYFSVSALDSWTTTQVRSVWSLINMYIIFNNN